MGSDEQSLEYSMSCEPAVAARLLELMAQYLKEGSVLLSRGDEAIALRFGPQIKFGLEAKAKPAKGKGSIELELSWEEPPKPREEGAPLEISAIPADEDMASVEETASGEPVTE